jgi:kynureninase
LSEAGVPSLETLRRDPNALASHYSRFRVGERLLLTGHSHQAWPDCGFRGQERAWLDAAEHLDEKWERAFAVAERVRGGFARLLGEPDAEIALGANTHELVTRFLSALPLAKRPRLVTTDAEFHTIRRQLDRLSEAGLEIAVVGAAPAATLAERVAKAVDERCAAALLSSVLFQTGQIVPGLRQLANRCERHGAELLIDVYHHLGVVPFSIADAGLDAAFVVGGGYKYCQLGEGNCFLRVPAGCTLRPVLTGWYSEFAALEAVGRHGDVLYGQGAARFAGATYDPTSHYRACEVFDFFEEQGLDAAFLRRTSQHQVGLLAARFDALDLDPGRITRDREHPLETIGGFLTLQSPRARAVCEGLRRRGVRADTRGGTLRLGPAPYLCDGQLVDAVDALVETTREDVSW